jgi:CRISPR-associated protein Cas6
VSIVQADMIDLVFDVSGSTLPVSYPYALWEELARRAPLLNENSTVGVVPLRMAESIEGMLLPKRAKLTIRLPQSLASAISALAHQQLDIAGSTLQLGACKPRPIQSYPTLHAQMVSGADDEIEFTGAVETALDAMEVKAKLICGRHHILHDGQQMFSGYSLVLHDLTPEGSLRVQYAGIGEGRRFGCGVFVPYKVISGLE